MWRRIGGLAAFAAAAAWPIGSRWLPEFVRSVIYDRVLFILGPGLGTYGPPAALVALGAYLFWLSGGKSWRLRPKETTASTQLAPMHEIVAHVAPRIPDTNASKCWPDARRAIRQAALKGDIQIYGHKSEDTGNPHATSWSLVSTPVPQTYWELADITPVATKPTVADELMHHTIQHQLSDGRFTQEQIAYYAKLTARWIDVKRKWP
jgi:hypothetical protein